MSVPKPPARGKRSKRSYKPAAERREQLLDCALSAFAERGYHGTSIADVCARAGVGRATLYQYFTDKRELLVALAERIAQRILDAHASRRPFSLPPGARPSQEQVVRFVQARFASVLGVVFEDAATARLVLRAGRGADGVVEEILRKIELAVLDTIEAELRAAKQAGVIRQLDERFVARFFLGGFEKIVMSTLDDDRPLEIEKIAREAALLEVCGIFPKQ
jgi:TetR/AcrR family transcriptional regulator, fatty acid metabolism regulator protein